MMHMKLSNKCRLIRKEYQINSSYQTAVQFESKLISIRRAKLYYITTLPFARRVFKIIVLNLKLQKQHENSKLKNSVYVSKMITKVQVIKIK